MICGQSTQGAVLRRVIPTIICHMGFDGEYNTYRESTGLACTAYGSTYQAYPGYYVGKHVYFGGSAGYYVVIGGTSSFNALHVLGTSGKWSVRFRYKWINRTLTSMVFSNFYLSSQVGCEIGFSSARKMYVRIGRGVSGQMIMDGVSTTAVPDDSNWHEYLVTYDQSLASANCNMYCDGVSLGTASKSAYTPSTANATNAARIGMSLDGTSYFNGYLDEFLVVKDLILDSAITTRRIYV